MDSVFISYEHHDSAVADDLCAYLENNGHACWIAPRDIVAGENYAGEIIRGVKGACAFIVICSSFTKDSGHVLNEVSIAFDQKIQIIPYCIEDTDLGDNMDYYLAAIHRIISTGNRDDDFKTILETLENGRSLPTQKDNKQRNKHIGIIAALVAIIIAVATAIAAGKINKSGSEASSSIPAPAEEAVQIQEQVEESIAPESTEALTPATSEVQEPHHVKIADEHQAAPVVAEVMEQDFPAAIEEPVMDDAAQNAVEADEEPAQEVQAKPLRESLADAKALAELEGLAEYYHVTINTSAQTIAESYLLICAQDGQIQYALSPQDASGSRVNLRTGEKVDRIDYTKGARVEYVKL